MNEDLLRDRLATDFKFFTSYMTKRDVMDIEVNCFDTLPAGYTVPAPTVINDLPKKGFGALKKKEKNMCYDCDNTAPMSDLSRTREYFEGRVSSEAYIKREDLKKTFNLEDD